MDMERIGTKSAGGWCLDISDMQIVDWYDGPIEALLCLGGQKFWHYCSLISWDFRTRLKVFAILRLETELAEWLLRGLRESRPTAESKEVWWKEFHSRIEDFIATCSDEVDLVLCEWVDEAISAHRRVELNTVKGSFELPLEEKFSPRHSQKWTSIVLNNLPEV